MLISLLEKPDFLVGTVDEEFGQEVFVCASADTGLTMMVRWVSEGAER
jgi:hypothetical protein